jgi:hypothetical protein
MEDSVLGDKGGLGAVAAGGVAQQKWRPIGPGDVQGRQVAAAKQVIGWKQTGKVGALIWA